MPPIRERFMSRSAIVVRRSAIVAAGALAATTLMAGPVLADPPSATPRGPWVEDAQNVSLERLHTYAELTDTLHRLDAGSDDISLRSIGQSNEGRDIWYAETGTGPTRLLYVTEQHGNEPLGTEAALNLLQNVGGSNSAWARNVRDNVTLGIVVRANPDGAERYQRQNVDPDCTGAFCTPGRGFDPNRLHEPTMAPEDNPAPEAAAVQRLFRENPYDVVVDFHHQGSYVAEDGELITTSIMWPNSPLAPAEAVDASRQVAVVTRDALEGYGFATVSQYPGMLNTGIARNSFGIQGAASMLVEIRGGIGQKSSGYLIRSAYATMAAVVDAAATGSLYDVNPADADTIPLRGDSVRDENE